MMIVKYYDDYYNIHIAVVETLAEYKYLMARFTIIDFYQGKED